MNLKDWLLAMGLSSQVQQWADETDSLEHKSGTEGPSGVTLLDLGSKSKSLPFSGRIYKAGSPA